jgi:hypothetical protein
MKKKDISFIDFDNFFVLLWRRGKFLPDSDISLHGCCCVVAVVVIIE